MSADTRKTYGVARLEAERCHECSCHIMPPCSGCENCAHPYTDDCDNDCQECEIDHD